MQALYSIIYRHCTVLLKRTLYGNHEECSGVLQSHPMRHEGEGCLHYDPNLDYVCL